MLKGRHWRIRDSKGAVHVVVFEYSSGTTLPTPSGTVEGSFQAVRIGDDGGTEEAFDVDVARFECIAPEQG
eukprot:gene52124-13569_t